jgi:hypothetical protein
MNASLLIDACERAIELRGTVMLALRDDDRRWCAFCVAVDGSVELRVGEPARGWRRWRPSDGEAWLRDHGFVHRVDAWSMPAPRGATPRMCAELVTCALREGLAAPADGELVEVLVHPGVIDALSPPAPMAPHAEHVRYVVSALAAHGRGKASIEGGRPAATWAWVFVVDGKSLELSPQPLDDSADLSRDWTVSLDDPDLDAQADKLTTILHDELGRGADEPLFISFMDV